MSLAMTTGLSTDQAPPLAVPMAFFLTAPLAMIATGVGLGWWADTILTGQWSPGALAVTHLGTLGFLGMVMVGALYQMIPVVAGIAVPVARLGHAVWLTLIVGLGALVYSLGWMRPAPAHLALWMLGVAFTLFIVPLVIALVRAPGGGPTVWGLRLAVLALLSLVGLGLRMAYGHATYAFPTDRLAWVDAHAVIGFEVWVGGLLVAVSWQVVPMFYLTEAYPKHFGRTTLLALATTLVLTLTTLAWPTSPFGRGLAALPAALAIWIVNPWTTWGLIRDRKRRRKDASVDFWRAGMLIAPVTFVAGALAWGLEDPRWTLLFGFLMVWGYAGLVMHGMLCRIVPFLVWFHRFAAWAGIKPVPAMRRLLPEKRAQLALKAHLAAIALGTVGFFLAWSLPLQLAGGAMVLTGVLLGLNLLKVLSHPAPKAD